MSDDDGKGRKPLIPPPPPIGSKGIKPFAPLAARPKKKAGVEPRSEPAPTEAEAPVPPPPPAAIATPRSEPPLEMGIPGSEPPIPDPISPPIPDPISPPIPDPISPPRSSSPEADGGTPDPSTTDEDAPLRASAEADTTPLTAAPEPSEGDDDAQESNGAASPTLPRPGRAVGVSPVGPAALAGSIDVPPQVPAPEPLPIQVTSELIDDLAGELVAGEPEPEPSEASSPFADAPAVASSEAADLDEPFVVPGARPPWQMAVAAAAGALGVFGLVCAFSGGEETEKPDSEVAADRATGAGEEEPESNRREPEREALAAATPPAAPQEDAIGEAAEGEAGTDETTGMDDGVDASTDSETTGEPLEAETAPPPAARKPTKKKAPKAKPSPSPAPSTPTPATPKPAPKPETAAELLSRAKKALAGGKGSEAKRLASKSYGKSASNEAAEVMTKGACLAGQVSAAKSSLQKVRPLRRGKVKTYCKKHGHKL